MTSTDHEATTREAVRERVFETMLAEAVSGDPAARPAENDVVHTHGPVASSPPPRRHLLVAATVLFGAMVAASVWWLDRSPAGREARGPQDPDRQGPALRSAVVGHGGEIDALPTDVGTLRIEAAEPADLARLPRLTHLRSVSMNARFGGGREQQWRALTPEQLEPLTRCTALQTLGVPFPSRLAAEHLAVLARIPNLRSLSVAGSPGMPLTDASVAALRTFPKLATLRFVGAELSVADYLLLRELPALRRLELYGPVAFDAPEFAAVCRIAQLERLLVTGLDRTTDPRFVGDADTWGPSADDLARLAALPHLRHLSLFGPEWTAARVAALPRGLTHLSLTSEHPFRVDGVRALRSLRALTSLGVGSLRGTDDERAAADAAFADLIAALPLTELDWSEPPSAAMTAAIAGSPRLERLELSWNEHTDFAPLARHPRLRELTLSARWPNTTPPAPSLAERLAPLRDCPSLRRVTLFARALPDDTAAALRDALGERVEFVHRR